MLYIPVDTLALSLDGSVPSKHSQPTLEGIREPCNASRAVCIESVISVVGNVNTFWWGLPERAVIMDKVLERLDEHVQVMTSVLDTCAA